eukprot:94527-Lingulodinium_polyedra.AAC.1
MRASSQLPCARRQASLDQRLRERAPCAWHLPADSRGPRPEASARIPRREQPCVVRGAGH